MPKSKTAQKQNTGSGSTANDARSAGGRTSTQSGNSNNSSQINQRMDAFLKGCLETATAKVEKVDYRFNPASRIDLKFKEKAFNYRNELENIGYRVEIYEDIEEKDASNRDRRYIRNAT